MASSDTTSLSVDRREAAGSRAARRLRRTGCVPGVVYGGDDDPVCFSVDAKTLRAALAHAGAVIDLEIDGSATPVVVKDTQRHPVTGEILHLDLLRVRLDRPIQATTVIDLVGADDAPGTKEGGVLEQVTREINIEALPTNIPDSIQHDVSGMQINETLTLAGITPPEGVTFLDDLEETVLATLTPPRIAAEEEEIEEETELVGEEAAAEGEEAAEAAGPGEAAGEESGDAASE